MNKAMHSEFEKDMTKIICEVCKVNDAIHYADSNYFCCSCISKKYTSLRSELQKQKELNAELVEGLKMARDLMKTHVPSSQSGLYVEWIEARDIIESLIKKSKES